MSGYQAILFAPDGDYVTDHRRDTIAEVWDAVNDQGSRWFFYPIPAVITDGSDGIRRKRIIETARPFEDLAGRTVATFAAAIADTSADALAEILS